MKKSIIIFKIILIMCLLITLFSTKSYASFWTEGFGYFLHDNTKINIDIELGKSGAEQASKEMTGRILGWIQLIGTVASVIALAVIGFRYMISSVEEKAEMKDVLIYYIVGAFLVFATSNLLSVVYNVLNGLEK